MDVVEAAAISIGVTVTCTGRRCARCGRDGAATPTGQVVSRSFTAYDSWQDPSGDLVCPVCVWGHLGVGVRNDIRHVHRDPPRDRVMSTHDAFDLLATEPIPPGQAVVIPLRPRRKHILPQAIWGRVMADDVGITWVRADTKRLATVRDLRESGVTPAQLYAPAPPHHVVNAAGSKAADVLAAWTALRPWRSPRNPWMAAAIRVTGTPDRQVQ